MMASATSRHHPPVYTDMVIVGNGPSAIALSFLLSGNRPYYNNEPVANEFLAAKLQDAFDKPITDQDLEYLSEGLEGRSANPVALLFDALFHPNADLGEDNPSALWWKKDEQQAISHVVLGKTRPGGSWQRMDGTMQTISQNSWMELPTLPFREWLHKRRSLVPGSVGKRATVADVKDYYLEFTEWAGIREHFYDYHIVTSVQKVFHLRSNADQESGEVEHCCQNIKQNHAFHWEVRGYKLIPPTQGQTTTQAEASPEREEFCFISHHVVLATGAYDIPNRLCIPGENLSNVVHSLAEFERRIQSGEVNSQSDPVVVVGAGLSAADTILMALGAKIPVIHVFRVSPNSPTLVFRKLPAAMYPEYHYIHSLMKTDIPTEDGLYRPFSRHRVLEVSPDGKVLLQSSAGSGSVIQTIDASVVLVMIGSRPDLSFLQQEGRYLGSVQDFPIDSKHNTILIDSYTYQCQHECSLYAMGPLVGDNFVRFGIGGALGITAHLSKSRYKHD